MLHYIYRAPFKSALSTSAESLDNLNQSILRWCLLLSAFAAAVAAATGSWNTGC